MPVIESSASNNSRMLIDANQLSGRSTSNPAPLVQNSAANVNANQAPAKVDTERESVRVSSTIGRAATSGQLSRQEALEIYRQIASLL